MIESERDLLAFTMDNTNQASHTTLGELSDKTIDKLFQDKNFLKKFDNNKTNFINSTGPNSNMGSQKTDSKTEKSKYFRF